MRKTLDFENARISPGDSKKNNFYLKPNYRAGVSCPTNIILRKN